MNDLLNTSTYGSNIIAEASAKLGTAGSAATGLIFVLDKALSALRNRARKGLLSNRGLNPEAMNVKEMETELGPVLATDLERWLEHHPHDALCMAVGLVNTALAGSQKKTVRTGFQALFAPQHPKIGSCKKRLGFGSYGSESISDFRVT